MIFNAIFSFLCCALSSPSPSPNGNRPIISSPRLISVESLDTVETWNTGTTLRPPPSTILNKVPISVKTTNRDRSEDVSNNDNNAPITTIPSPKSLKRRIILWFKRAKEPREPRDSRRFSFIPEGFEIVSRRRPAVASPHPEPPSATDASKVASEEKDTSKRAGMGEKKGKKRGDPIPPPKESGFVPPPTTMDLGSRKRSNASTHNGPAPIVSQRAHRIAPGPPVPPKDRKRCTSSATKGVSTSVTAAVSSRQASDRNDST